MTNDYQRLIAVHSEAVQGLKKQYNLLAVLRLISILSSLTFGYFAVRYHITFTIIGAGISFLTFLVFLRFHTKIKKQLLLENTLLGINQVELNFLEKGELSFEDGVAFLHSNHPYTYDLDVFGPHSLFHHLNRSKTVMGSTQLANALLERSPDELILQRQEATQELTSMIEWRQDFMAKGILAKDSEKIVATLRSWNSEQAPLTVALKLMSYVFPALGLSLTIAGIIKGFNPLLLNLSVTVFIINLITLASQLKKMNREIAFADKINETLLRYSELLLAIEQVEWKSDVLKEAKLRLIQSETTASKEIHTLSRIFASLESLQNGFGAIIFNGLVQYHLHTYRKLIHWKQAHAQHLTEWLALIGEMEVLISFANLNYNNPDFTYPSLNQDAGIQFSELGHPLIKATKRVSNSVDFSDKPFIILTGSNMSGKSTFLRTLGINLILANAGSSICAKAASVQPMDILVSMRLSDSLTDSESYFFAEVKRLKEIMMELDNRRCFILLDEILRGTNSDDKRTGTIEVVKKVISKNAIGAIATHDLEVCNTTYEFPDLLINKCFEVEIIDDELHFDYLLRDGICKNKSATFLMQKMGVI